MYTLVLIDPNCNECFKTHSISRIRDLASCLTLDSFCDYQYELWYSSSHTAKTLLDTRQLLSEKDFEHLKKIVDEKFKER